MYSGLTGNSKNVRIKSLTDNNANAGVWLDYLIESPEDQTKFIVPLNRDTEHLWDNIRMIIDAPVLTEPRCWVITKINRLTANGINHVTLAQDRYDSHKDYAELDEDGNVLYWWADYYQDSVEPVSADSTIEIPETETKTVTTISYSGLKPEIKVGGSYKKFTVDTEDLTGTWSFTINDESVEDKVTVLTSADSTDVEDDQIKVKFIGDSTYIGENLVIRYESELTKAEVIIAVISL